MVTTILNEQKNLSLQGHNAKIYWLYTIAIIDTYKSVDNNGSF